MSLLVVIVNYRTWELTLRAADAVRPQLASMPGSHIAIVDNHSEDGSADALTEAIQERGWSDHVELIEADRNGGFAYGINLAVRPALATATPPRYVYLVNPDARPEPGAIAALVELLEKRPEAGIVGSGIHGLDGEIHRSAFRFPSAIGEFESAVAFRPVSWLLRSWIVAPPMPTQPARVDWVSGASLLINADLLRSVGLFDEDYFLYYEETDLCLRARRAGWQVWFEPAARVEHIGSASTGYQDQSKPRASYWFAARRRYFQKNHGRTYLWAANLLWLLGFVLWRGRAWIQRKPNRYPPQFAGDFLRYSFRSG